MSNYLYGNTPSTIYKQLLSVGGTADRVGLTSSLKAVWTDDGAGSAASGADHLPLQPAGMFVRHYIG